jgi:dienelactone hydrolase
MISDYLYRPPTQEARPAILMMHGCSGLLTKKYGRLKSRDTAWRDIFIAEDYVVLLLDSFTERGHRSICRTALSDRPIKANHERLLEWRDVDVVDCLRKRAATSRIPLP